MFKSCEFVAHATVVNCLSIGPSSQSILATGGEDAVVHIWDTDSRNIWKLSGNKTAVECVAFNPTEEYCASGARSGAIKIFDVNEGRVARNLRGHPICTNCLYYHPHADILVSGSQDNSVKAWDLRNKECLMTCPGHDKQVSSVRFSPDGRWLVTTGLDGKVIFWDVVAGKVFHTLRLPSGCNPTQLEFSPTELYAAVNTSARTCLVYDCENDFQQIAATPADSSQIRSIAFSNQGRCLCTAVEGSLRVYELPNNLYWKEASGVGEAAPFQLLRSVKVGWDRVADMRLDASNNLIAGCFNANFVSLHSGGVNSIVDEVPEDQRGEGKDADYGDGDEGRGGGGGAKVSSYSPRSARDRDEQQHHGTPADPKEDQRSRRSASSAGGGDPDEQYEDRYGAEDDDWESDPSAAKAAQEADDAVEEKLERVGKQLADARVTPRKPHTSDVSTPRSSDKTPSSQQKLRAGGVRSRVQAAGGVTPDSGAKGKPQGRLQTAGSPDGGMGDFAIVGNRHSGVSGGLSRDRYSEPRGDVRLALKLNSAAADAAAGRRHESAGTGDDVLETLLETRIADGRDFTSKLLHRLSGLRILQQHWTSGDMSAVINEMQLMYESNRSLTLRSMQPQGAAALRNPSKYIMDDPDGASAARQSHLLVHESKQPIMVIADFLLCTSGLKTPPGRAACCLTLDLCVQLLPILDNMLNDSSLEHVIRASVCTVATLCDAFGDVISNTRTNMQILGVGNGLQPEKAGVGVDLSREERIRKCNQCYIELDKINSRVKSLKRLVNTSTGGGSGHGNKRYTSATVSELNNVETKLAGIV